MRRESSFSDESAIPVCPGAWRDRRSKGHEGRTTYVTFAPDGKRLASGSSDGEAIATACDDGAVRIWDRSGASPKLTLTGHEGVVLDVDFSPDGELLSAGGLDGTVGVWKVSSGEFYRAFGEMPRPVERPRTPVIQMLEGPAETWVEGHAAEQGPPSAGEHVCAGAL